MLYGNDFVSIIYLRFLLKKNKAQGEEDGEEATETAAMPTTPIAKETTPSPSSQPDPAPSHPEMSTKEVPIKNSSPHRSMATHPATPTPASATSTLPVQQEAVPNSQDAVRPKLPPVERGMPEEDGEKAGPSGLNSHPSSSSSSSTPSAPFIPFSGGGQRLGGPRGGATGHPVSSSSVESPKAKKAKSSHGSSTKVSYITKELQTKKVLRSSFRIFRILSKINHFAKHREIITFLENNLNMLHLAVIVVMKMYSRCLSFHFLSTLKTFCPSWLKP